MELSAPNGRRDLTFLLEFREGLLKQLYAIEREAGITRTNRCPVCDADLRAKPVQYHDKKESVR